MLQTIQKNRFIIVERHIPRKSYLYPLCSNYLIGVDPAFDGDDVTVTIFYKHENEWKIKK